MAELLAGLRSVGECRALRVLEEALHDLDGEDTKMTNETRGELVTTIT